MATYIPTYTPNTAGNALAAGTTIAASASTNFNIDVSAHMEGVLQCSGTGGGTVAATSGMRVDVYPRVGTGPANDTIAQTSVTIPMVVSTASLQSIRLQPGKYNIKFTNLDASNAIADRSATLDTVDISG
jgi:hypothetical protein